ncbi:MAG: Ig-like domain-containing protein [Kofleriaceae bacterium]
MRQLGVGALVLVAACGGDDPTSASTTSSTEQSVWTNGDFEQDSIGQMPPTGWTLTTYLNYGITDTRPSSQTYESLDLDGQTGQGTSMSYIVGGAAESQADPDIGTGGTLRFPKYGTRAARINYMNASTPGKNENVNSLRQQMTVGVGDVDASDNKVHVRFAVAPVLENPGHSYDQQPYYFVRLQNLTKGTTIYADFNASGQTGVPWKNFTDASGQAAQYTDWQLVDISPGNAALAVGDQVELLVIASGCAAGGHWGRVYVDAVGSGVPGLYTWATGAQQANAGTDLTYTINYKNGGTTTTTNTKVDLVTPPSTVYKSTTGGSCTAPAAGATGTVSCSVGSLAPGATGQYTITVTIPGSTSTGTVITNGNYSIYADSNSALVGPKVQTTVTNGASYANLGITKTDGVAAVGWGSSTTYTINVSNQGPLASGATVTDTMPANLTGVTWTCAAANGATCTASGSGNIADSVNLPVGGTLTYTVSASIVSGSGSSSVVNTATVATSGSTTDPDTTDNSAVDTDTIGTLDTLAVTKTGTPSAGSIASSPAAISCGTGCSTTSAQFVDGTQVQLTATPSSGSTFVGWGGSCSGTATTCTVTMSGAMNVTAQFAGAPATIAATGGASQTTSVSTAFAQPLAVTVSDANGTPVPGVSVAYTKPGSGASATMASSATTSSSGVASVSATANATPGAYTVTATAGSVSTTFSLANIGAPNAITIVSGNNQSATVAQTFSQHLIAKVTDSANQPVAGASVGFVSGGATASAALISSPVTTDSSGQATLDAVANTTAGSYTLTVGVSGKNVGFSLTNTAGAVASLSATGGSGQSARVTQPFATQLTAHAADAYGNSVPGASVAFSAPYASFSAAALTNASGNTTTTATAGTLATQYTATATSGAFSATYSLSNTPGPAATIAVQDGAPQDATVTQAFAAPIRVIAKDAQGNTTPGESISFVAPTTGPTAALSGASATTDQSGIAGVTATANTKSGSYDVTASLTSGATVALHLTNDADAPYAIAVVPSSSPQRMTVLQQYSSPLAITVTDQYGNPAPNATVTYSAPSAPAATATLAPLSTTTDSTGTAQTTATASAKAGAFVVYASVTGIADPVAFSLSNTAGSPANLSVSTGDAQSTTVDHDFSAALAVLVQDADGNPVPNAVITYTAPTTDATASLSAGTAQTDSTGVASITAHASHFRGTYNVTASATGASSPLSFALTNNADAPASIVAAEDATPQAQEVSHAYVHALVAHVYDQFGNNVPNATVTYSAPATGATSTLSASSVQTADDGTATVSATASSVSGSYPVYATTGALAPAEFDLNNLAGPAQTITVVAGAHQNTTVHAAFATSLSAIVRDQYGNPVPAAQVTFTAPVSGASASLGTPSSATAADGTVSTSVTAGNVAGNYNIVATTPLGTAPAAYAMTNNPGLPATAVANAAATPQSAQVDNAFAQSLAVTVFDTYGNRVPNATVTFTTASSPGATLSASTAKTDAQGNASVLAQADSKAGSYAVTAAVTGTPGTEFDLTNTSAAPANVVVTSGGLQQALATTAFAAPVAMHVIDSFGNPVGGVQVALTIAGGGATATMSDSMPMTDDNGDFSVSLTAGPVVGTFTVVATAPNALGAGRAQLEIMPIPTTIDATADTATPVDGVVHVKITVTGQLGQPTGQVSIVDNAGQSLGTATLDNGQATIDVKDLAIGHHSLSAVYAAQGSYGESSSTTFAFDITEDSGSLSGGGCNAGGAGNSGSLLVIGLALFGIVLPRRKALVAGILAAAGVAHADDANRAIDRFHAATPDSQWLSLDSATYEGDKVIAVSATGDFAKQPLAIYDADGTMRSHVVDDAFLIHLGASVVLQDKIRISAALPLAPYQHGPGGTYNGMSLASPDGGVGDLTVAGDYRFFGEAHGLVRLAAGARIGVPTGSTDSYLGDGKWSFEPRVALGGSYEQFEYAASVSAFLRGSSEMAGAEFGSEFRYAAAGGMRFVDGKLLVGPELLGATPLQGGTAVGTPLELDLGAHYTISPEMRASVGGGLGVVNAIGEPTWRTMAAFSWMPR